jgi:hypothetical protein
MSDKQWVPKIHPASRAVESEDPMMLVANPVAGDPDQMLACVVQEFAWMGFDTEALLALFGDRFYPVLFQLREYYGEDELRRRIEAQLEKSGVMRFHEIECEASDPQGNDDRDEPQLVHVTIPAELRQAEGTSHADGI